MLTTNRSAPTASIVPILVCEDAGAAVSWLCEACGFTERLRHTGQAGEVTHAQLDFGNGSVMIGRAGGPFAAPAQQQSVSFVTHVAVTDVDAHHARTTAAGARIIQGPQTMPFGERQYTLADPGGHWWTFSQHVADIAPEDWGAVVPARGTAAHEAR